MANIWKQNRDASQNVKRNNFDLSFQSHSTFKFGYLYPVFKRRVVPGDSFRIDSAFDLKMMPVAFPIQSRIRAHMHFFYVRNKNLWKNWQDWLVGIKTQADHPHPYIRVNDSDVKTGSIHDFLGQPTTYATSDPSRFVIGSINQTLHSVGGHKVSFWYCNINHNVCLSGISEGGGYIKPTLVFPITSNTSGFRFSSSMARTLFDEYNLLDNEYGFQSPNGISLIVADGDFSSREGGRNFTVKFSYPIIYNTDGFVTYREFTDEQKALVASSTNPCVIVRFEFTGFDTTVEDRAMVSDDLSIEYSVPNTDVFGQWSEVGIPFYTDNVVPLTAMPYRAYESIYRAYYASDVWQPLVIDGQKEYNKYVTNDDDGEDRTNYHLFRRNYELDFLTSALPSPQDGPAPLVGIVDASNRIISIKDEDGETQVKLGVDTDGRITDADVVSDIASGKHAKFAAALASGREYVQGLGFTINDFRAGNAYQRFKEWTMRVGYRYQKFVKGHFDVEPEYKELDMPEFIGGYSRDVDISTVVSQADTLLGSGESATGKELGEFTGLGRLVGGSNHSITHYCDDFGWIIGIMCITPTPAYSQLLPKENICPTSPLDYSFPEFNQLGYQPIPYKEVSPLQIAYNKAFGDNSLDYESTFGYQRPCYDLVGSVDEVHGEFRDSLHSMLINRIFSQPPQLGSSFLEIDPSEVNDIFINQNPDDDVFVGHLAFKVTPKRPYPRVHIPSLGL